MHNVQSIHQHAVGLLTELRLTRSHNSPGPSLPARQLRDLTGLQADLQNAVLKGQVKLRMVVSTATGARTDASKLTVQHTLGAMSPTARLQSSCLFP